jgi:GNAT superfamily N-acetyltransferase
MPAFCFQNRERIVQLAFQWILERIFMTTATEPGKTTIKPLTEATWPDFERLFSPNANCAGCWCTWWRLSSTDFQKLTREEKKNNLRTLVQSGRIPGLLAFDGEDAVGWVAVAPREEFPRLERSKKLARVDDLPVWSINCFFIERKHRKSGLSRLLIEAAVDHAARHGASIVEAYPIDTREKVGNSRLYHGVAATFQALGFVEVARRDPVQPVMRKTV